MGKNSLDLARLLVSWERVLKSEHKSPNTIALYQAGVNAYLRWCERTNSPAALDRAQVQSFVGGLLDNGASPATALARHKALRHFAAWLVIEGEIEVNPLEGMRPPRQDTKITRALSDDELRALVKACQGKTFRDRRDEAIVRLMAETGLRASEVIGLKVADVDLGRELVTIHRGKGGKGRVVPIGAQTIVVIDRYLRMRAAHKLASSAAMWLGVRSKTFGYAGLDGTMKDRAKTAGVTSFHLHLLRHTFATRWKAAQGSDDGLMAVAGWSSRTLIDRYAGAAAAQRAGDEAKRLNLGDL